MVVPPNVMAVLPKRDCSQGCLAPRCLGAAALYAQLETSPRQKSTWQRRAIVSQCDGRGDSDDAESEQKCDEHHLASVL